MNIEKLTKSDVCYKPFIFFAHLIHKNLQNIIVTVI